MRILSLFLFTAILLFAAEGCKDVCDDIDCGANGVCLDGTCQCDEGYTGTNCETKICDTLDCGPNGTCNEQTGTCDCAEGYSGANCENNVCDLVDCGANTTCNMTTGECICIEGYEGDNCEIEIREKYYGTYQGDLVPCIPALVLGFIEDEDLELLKLTPLEILSSPNGILLVSIGSSSTVLSLNAEADVTADSFVIPPFSREVDANGSTVTVSGDGTGKLVDAQSMVIDLKLNYKIDILNLSSECSVTFTKI